MSLGKEKKFKNTDSEQEKGTPKGDCKSDRD